MTKEHILSEIKRTAKSNGDIPFGADRFFSETGIREADWRGKHWVRWGDALREAGFMPNQWIQGYSDDFVIGQYIDLIRELGRLPVFSELDMKRRIDERFPSGSVFRRLGSTRGVIAKVIKYCEEHAGFDDILLLCKAVKFRDNTIENETSISKVGYVYLLKHGSRREYKIGKTFNPLRREGEIGLQLPDKLEPIHYIKTDDPSGVEAYWHTRFRDKRKGGEWFVLIPSDVNAFKKWRNIY